MWYIWYEGLCSGSHWQVAVVARTLLQPMLKVARLAAKTCTRATVNSKGANEKGKVRLECAAAVHLMRNKGWETLIDECVHKGGGWKGDVLQDNCGWTYAASGGLVLVPCVCLHGRHGGLLGVT